MKGFTRIVVLTLALCLAMGAAVQAATLKIGSQSPPTGPYPAHGNAIAHGPRAPIPS